jgi:alpha-1,3-rhamnosyl/mannosyltransferase
MSHEVVLYAHRLGAAAPTGIGRYVAQLTSALHEGAPDLRFAVCSTRETERPTWVPPGVEIRRVGGNRQAVQLSWALLGRPKLERRVATGDLVHFMSPSVPVPTRRPFVCTVHDLMPITHGGWFTAKERWLARLALRQMVDGAHCIITDSMHVADDIVDRLGVERSRLAVVHPGVTSAFSATGAVDADSICARYGVRPGNFFIYVGSVDRRKNLSPLLRAMALASTRRGRLRLLIVGPRGHGAHEVDAEVARLGLGEMVRLAGYVSDTELAVLVASAVALVHPSSFEGFGLTPLEAMAAGTATAVSGHGALPEVVGDAALVVDQDNAEGWAVALARLADDEDLRADLRIRGRARAAGFSWANAAQATAAVYRRVLSSAG